MAITQQISALLDAPSITDPATFEAKADVFLNTDLPQLRNEINAWAGQANVLAAAINAIAGGAAVSIAYTFSSTTADADPGAGRLRLGNATQSSSTVIRVDVTDAAGADWSSALDTFDDSTSTIKGHIALMKAGDGSKWLLFSVSALASPSGYRNITVSCVASSSTTPFADGDDVLLKFTRNGDKGATGAIGTIGVAPAPNLLINSNFMINQRGLSSVSDATYDFDRWYVLTQTAAVTPSQLIDPEVGAPFGARLNQSQAAAQRFGRAQIVESLNCHEARSAAVTFSGRARMSSAQTVSYALLEWTGTADSPTRDIVSDWTNGSYTGGNFFISANLNVLQVGGLAVSANTWTSFSLTATCGASMNNLIVFVWTEAVQVQNVKLDLDNCQLEIGSTATAWQPLKFVQEFELCQRYYEKTFDPDTTPASNTGAGGSFNGLQIVPNNNSQQFPSDFRFRVPKRATPTITTYNPGSVSSQIRNLSTASNWSSISVSCDTQVVGIGGLSAGSIGDLIGIHFTADAEI